MASEEHDEWGASFALPPGVDDWIDGQAERRDEEPADVCRRILTAAHSLATDETIDEPAGREDLDDLRATVDAQREEFVDLLEDVRDRVVQVKRETDGKAPADHAHPETATTDDVAELSAELERLDADLDALEETVDGGFSNFEEILDHLVAETETLEARSRTLATAILELRDRRSALLARDRERAEAEALQLAANRLGIRTADCEECGSSVDLALLTEPACPHCASSFADVQARRSILRSHVLLTGDPPALPGLSDGAGTTDDERLETIVDEVIDGD